MSHPIMGLGKLGQNNLVFINKKYRYTIEAKLGDEQIIEPQWAKVIRPALDIQENEKGEMVSSQWAPVNAIYYGLDEKLLPELVEKWNNLPPLAMAVIRLYDGCGVEIETWELWNAKAECNWSDYNPSEWGNDLEVTLKYEGVNYNALNQKK